MDRQSFEEDLQGQTPSGQERLHLSIYGAQYSKVSGESCSQLPPGNGTARECLSPPVGVLELSGQLFLASHPLRALK